MRLDWQEANFGMLVKVVAVLKEYIGDNIVVAGFYTGNTNKGAIYSDATEIMADFESDFTTVEQEIENLQSIIEDNDMEQYVLDGFKNDIAALEKLNGDLYIRNDWNDKTTDDYRDNITTYTDDEVGVIEFTDDAMNGHTWSGTVDEAIDSIIEMVKNETIQNDVWEIVRFVGFRYDRELRDIDMEEFVDTVCDYFADAIKSKEWNNEPINVGEDYIFICSNDANKFEKELKSFYDKNSSEDQDFEYDDFEDFVYCRRNFFGINEEFYDNFIKNKG